MAVSREGLKWAFIYGYETGNSPITQFNPFMHYDIETNPSALTFYVTTIIMF
jgi:hypothetical protein